MIIIWNKFSMLTIDDGRESFKQSIHCNLITLIPIRSICFVWYILSMQQKRVQFTLLLQSIFNRANRLSLRLVHPVHFHVIKLIKRFNSLFKCCGCEKLEFQNEWSYCCNGILTKPKLFEPLASPVMLCSVRIHGLTATILLSKDSANPHLQ